MDAIESGIVKLPRVPIADGTIEQIPIYRNIYKHVREDLPRRGARNQGNMNPENLPSELMGALTTLYGHYENAFKLWEAEKVGIPPVFIIVCNNTSTSKLVYDLVSGYKLPNGRYKKGKLKLFSNIDEDGEPMSRPHTLLIDSVQLESGDALSNEFKQIAADEIETFKHEMQVRYPGRDVDNISDSDILRGVMNTVGKKDKMGEQIRCVVSVSMLTEGWDANNVTHILGIRAFGTQLLCEQVVGRALRRLSYDTDEHDKFAPEYADVFGVPFVFANNSKAEQTKPKSQTRIRHLEERRFFEINYPRLRGYKYAPPESRLVAKFNENSRLVLRLEDAPPKVQQGGIVGKKEMMTLDELKQHRINEVVFNLASYTAKEHYRNEDGSVSPERFRDLIPIVRDWMDDYLTCLDNTFKQYLLWESLAAKAANRIYRACTVHDGNEKLLPVFDPFTPEGSTYDVDFLTSKKRLHPTVKSHINIAVCDSDWEMNFCQLLEDNIQVYAYTRNAGLGFQVPYIADNKKERQYFPDFIIIANDKGDKGDLLNLVIEIKGFKDGDAQAKADTMDRSWIPAMNNDGRYGRWKFAEIRDMQNARKILAKLINSGQKKIAYV